MDNLLHLYLTSYKSVAYKQLYESLKDAFLNLKWVSQSLLLHVQKALTTLYMIGLKSPHKILEFFPILKNDTATISK